MANFSETGWHLPHIVRRSRRLRTRRHVWLPHGQESPLQTDKQLRYERAAIAANVQSGVTVGLRQAATVMQAPGFAKIETGLANFAMAEIDACVPRQESGERVSPGLGQPGSLAQQSFSSTDSVRMLVQNLQDVGGYASGAAP